MSSQTQNVAQVTSKLGGQPCATTASESAHSSYIFLVFLFLLRQGFSVVLAALELAQ